MFPHFKLLKKNPKYYKQLPSFSVTRQNLMVRPYFLPQSQRTWRNQAGTHLESSSFLVGSVVLESAMLTTRGKYKPQACPEVNFEATTMTSLTRYALWDNNFMNVMRLTKQFLIGP